MIEMQDMDQQKTRYYSHNTSSDIILSDIDLVEKEEDPVTKKLEELQNMIAKIPKIDTFLNYNATIDELYETDPAESALHYQALANYYDSLSSDKLREFYMVLANYASLRKMKPEGNPKIEDLFISKHRKIIELYDSLRSKWTYPILSQTSFDSFVSDALKQRHMNNPRILDYFFRHASVAKSLKNLPKNNDELTQELQQMIENGCENFSDIEKAIRIRNAIFSGKKELSQELKSIDDMVSNYIMNIYRLLLAEYANLEFDALVEHIAFCKLNGVFGEKEKFLKTLSHNLRKVTLESPLSSLLNLLKYRKENSLGINLSVEKKFLNALILKTIEHECSIENWNELSAYQLLTASQHILNDKDYIDINLVIYTTKHLLAQEIGNLIQLCCVKSAWVEATRLIRYCYLNTSKVNVKFKAYYESDIKMPMVNGLDMPTLDPLLYLICLKHNFVFNVEKPYNIDTLVENLGFIYYKNGFLNQDYYNISVYLLPHTMSAVQDEILLLTYFDNEVKNL